MSRNRGSEKQIGGVPEDVDRPADEPKTAAISDSNPAEAARP
jgi:hypothetical protein